MTSPVTATTIVRDAEAMIATYSATLEGWDQPLTAPSLMAWAERRTGLSDWGGQRWGEERFRHDFALLCDSIEDTGAITPLGRDRSFARIMVMLLARLRYLDARKHTPGIDDERIVAPLIGTGMPRAGTTFLHGVLAQDPNLRVAKAFEAAIPVPLPGPDGDMRSALYQKSLTLQGLTTPEMRALHPYDAELPEEDLYIQDSACSAIFGGLWNVPAFMAATADKMPDTYEWQIGMMQYMQTLRRGERWALKTGAHIMAWNEMQLAFPDALVYVNHRDPGKVIPSMANLMGALQGVNSGGVVDLPHLGQQQLVIWGPTMNAYAAWRQGPGRDANVMDVIFSDLTSRTMEIVAQLYDTFGLNLTSEARDLMLRHLDRDHHGKGPQRVYSLADYGVAEADIEATFGAYIDQFGIKRERR